MTEPTIAYIDCDPRDRTCEGCPKTFRVPFVGDPQRYCSKSCAMRVVATARVSARNSNWRGGKAKHYLYRTYMEMVARCGRVTHQRYSSYGGRGIVVCQRWRDDFWAFVLTWDHARISTAWTELTTTVHTRRATAGGLLPCSSGTTGGTQRDE